jgi:hypothetical protein
MRQWFPGFSVASSWSRSGVRRWLESCSRALSSVRFPAGCRLCDQLLTDARRLPLRLPYRPVLLMPSRPRPEKQLLRVEERWEAVRGAFAMRKGGRVDNLRILLLDDVMTTGVTLDACSRALGEAGAKAVLGLTIARARRVSFVAAR